MGGNKKPFKNPVILRTFVRIVTLLSGASYVIWPSGCCENPQRSWTVSGTVIDEETQVGVSGAAVDITLVFTIDGPGNQVLDRATTDQNGAFSSSIVFTADCVPTPFGFFGSEASNTSGSPLWVDVTVVQDDTVTDVEFSVRRDPQLVTSLETFADGEIRGRIELPPITVGQPR